MKLKGIRWEATSFLLSSVFLNVSHLGQVEYAILEANGKLSLFYYPDTQVIPGLPILPDHLADYSSKVLVDELYACTRCGFTSKVYAQEETL